MLLRRIIEHVRDQNWIAIGLDFVIVVSGVFIGIQVANFNDDQSDRRDYELALDRYLEEIKINLEMLDARDEAISRSNELLTAAFDILLSCEETPDNRALVHEGLRQMRGTSSFRLSTSALYDLTENQSLLAQQSEDVRQLLTETRTVIDRMLVESDFAERYPLEEPFVNNSNISIGEKAARELNYAGKVYSIPNRTLRLAVPLDVACKDNMLIKSFYVWEAWQSVMPIFSLRMREVFEKDLEALN